MSVDHADRAVKNVGLLAISKGGKLFLIYCFGYRALPSSLLSLSLSSRLKCEATTRFLVEGQCCG